MGVLFFLAGRPELRVIPRRQGNMMMVAFQILLTWSGHRIPCGGVSRVGEFGGMIALRYSIGGLVLIQAYSIHRLGFWWGGKAAGKAGTRSALLDG